MLKKHRPLSRRSLLSCLALLPGAVFALTAGCGGGSSDSTSSQTRQTVERVQGPFRITASIPKRTYRKGEAVEITFTVTNTSTEDLLAYYSVGQSASSLNEGERLGQFSVVQGDTVVYDSLPQRGEERSELIRAGKSVRASFRWEQSDFRQLLTRGRLYPPGAYDSNTATSGEYQIVPRLNSRQYFNYVVLPNYQGPDPEKWFLLDEEQNKLPPLNITIEP